MAEESGCLMRSLDRAVRRGDPAQLLIAGRGTLCVYPRQHCYVSDIQDWDGAYTAACAQISVTSAAWNAPPRGARPLEELQWRAAFHSAHAEGAPAATAALRDLLHLLSWPNLTRLPEELVVPVTRVCAHLWRKPTAGFVLPRVLDLPSDRTAAIVYVLQAFGHVRGSVAPGGDAPPSEPQREPEPSAVQEAAVQSVLSRLWQRLLRTQEA